MSLAEDLVRSRAVNRYISQIESDADDALASVRTTLAFRHSNLFPRNALSTLRRDAGRLNTAMGRFNEAWNRVSVGRDTEMSRLMRAYSQMVLALEILEEQNALFEAVIRLQGLELLLVLIRAAEHRARRRRNLMRSYHARMREIISDAQWDVTSAEIQRALNVVISVASLCLGPLGVGARATVAFGFLSHTAVDAAFGPSRGSVEGTVNTAVGEVAGVYTDTSRKVTRLSRAASGVSAVITLGLDSQEVAAAEARLARLQTRIRRFERDFAKDHRHYVRHMQILRAMAAGVDNAMRQARQEAARYRANRNRQQLLREFQSFA